MNYLTLSGISPTAKTAYLHKWVLIPKLPSYCMLNIPYIYFVLYNISVITAFLSNIIVKGVLQSYQYSYLSCILYKLWSFCVLNSFYLQVKYAIIFIFYLRNQGNICWLQGLVILLLGLRTSVRNRMIIQLGMSDKTVSATISCFLDNCIYELQVLKAWKTAV